jgi:putative hydroxymethylpyrimidine transport system permease protein
MTAVLRTVIIAICFILLWQSCVYYFQIPYYLLPSPFRVLTVLFQQFPLIVSHALPTLFETSVGFLLGVLLGCSAAIAIAVFKPLTRWCLPLLIMSQSIPIFAIAPLLVIWLGYGFASKIATTVLMIFFPITSAFYDGLSRTQPGWLDLAKIMNSSTWRTFCAIRIPAAMPALASGIRIAAVIAPIGAIVGEWVGSSSGLGYLMINANARMQIDLMFAALMVIMLLALILYVCVDKLLHQLVWWQ